MANQKKPPTTPRSIRLPDTVWSDVADEAARRKVSVNALVLRAVLKEIGQWSDEEVAAMRAKPRPALAINRIPEAPKAKPVVSRLKGEWKAP